MKTKNRTIWVFMINVMAFAFAMGTIRSVVEFSVFLKLFIPLLVVFVTNLSTTMVCLKNYKKNKDHRAGDDSPS